MRFHRAWPILASVALLLAVPCPAGAAERTYTKSAGPYRLAGFETVLPRHTVSHPPVNGWVTRMHARLVDGRGRAVTLREVMLHHVLFSNTSADPPRGYCISRGREPFYGTGEENQALNLPPGYGYRLRRADRWRIQAMLMSHSSQARKVYVEYRVTVDTDARRPVLPFWIRASGCAPTDAWSIPGGGPPGWITERVERWPVPFDGRIVAAGGHLHGGAVDLRMTQPACGGRLLFHNRPAYGAPDHPVYGARPVLHEIGPIATSWFSSSTGIGVRRGEVLELHGMYDGEHPHPGVMAITHVYIAPSRARPKPCEPLPSDQAQTAAPPGARAVPPWAIVPLSTLDDRGRAVTLSEPPGATISMRSGGTVAVRDSGFAPAKVALPLGGRVNFRWTGQATHNIKFANGPTPVGSRVKSRGTVISRNFTVPGRYQLFCSRHPMTMHAQVTVGQ